MHDCGVEFVNVESCERIVREAFGTGNGPMCGVNLCVRKLECNYE